MLDPGRHNKLHNLQLHISAVLDVRELTETFDYEIISEALFHTEVMLFNKLPLVNALTNISNTFVTVFIHLCLPAQANVNRYNF